MEFVAGDVRELPDLAEAGAFDALVECSAEPSVLAGVDGTSRLRGADEPARGVQLPGGWHGATTRRSCSSRPAACTRSPLWSRSRTRRARRGSSWATSSRCPARRRQGISEAFPLSGARTIYGATKLAAELLIEEYGAAYGLSAVIDRCGVIAGPWQMGKVDQGVFTYWVLAHHFSRPLSYIGFEGSGKQVRDLLHVDDLLELIDVSSPIPTLGRRHGQRRRGPRVQPLAARDDRVVPGDHG